MQVFVITKQRWNKDKCRCEYIQLIINGICYKGFDWNSRNYKRECDKSCHVGEYLEY